MSLPTAIEFKKVTKKYLVQQDRTFKELLPSLLLGKSWASHQPVFHDLSFAIQRGETVAIVGKNGAGKSTVMKLIAGVTYPTKGKVKVHGRVAPLIELGAGFHHELTGYENIFLNAAILGMHKREIEAVLDEIIEFSELGEFIDVPVKRYSSGMYMRLAFSIAIHTQAPILLIDEVLAVGDIEFQRKCLKQLNQIKAERDRTIVFVSHDEKAVVSFCDRAILLSAGEIVYDGKPTEAFRHYHQLPRAES